MNEGPKETIDRDIIGVWGFVVVWSVESQWANLKAYKITARPDDGRPLFAKKNWESLPNDETEHLDDAEIYLEGFVKWDGCSELNQGQPHWCGPDDYKKHMAILKWIYHRAFELMGREPEEEWGYGPNSDLIV
jgi:hypothetical protein